MHYMVVTAVSKDSQHSDDSSCATQQQPMVWHTGMRSTGQMVRKRPAKIQMAKNAGPARILRTHAPSTAVDLQE